MVWATGFIPQLRDRWVEADSMVCVGWDPEIAKFPAHLQGLTVAEALRAFFVPVIDACAPYVCAFKPQIAHFAALGAEDVLQELIAYSQSKYPSIPVILDSKRGDIGSTAAQYAAEAFDRYHADAVTVNPYLGIDGVAPFLAVEGRGVVVLCRTSNPSAGDFQDLLVDGVPLYQRVASQVAAWDEHKQCALVVGATWPSQLAEVRALVGDMPLLVPGVGAQGGSARDVVLAGRDSCGYGLIINSSRGVLYASSGADFAEVAASVTRELRDEIRAVTP